MQELPFTWEEHKLCCFSPTVCYLLGLGRKPSYCNKTSVLFFFSGDLPMRRVKRGTLISVRLELTSSSYFCFPLPPYLLRHLSCSWKRLHIHTLMTIRTIKHALKKEKIIFPLHLQNFLYYRICSRNFRPRVFCAP